MTFFQKKLHLSPKGGSLHRMYGGRAMVIIVQLIGEMSNKTGLLYTYLHVCSFICIPREPMQVIEPYHLTLYFAVMYDNLK